MSSVLIECLFTILSATYDVKKSIGDIALNVHGSQIAIVENQGGFDSVEESAVRIYNVGRKRNEDNNAVRSNLNDIVVDGGQSDINRLVLVPLQEDEEEEEEDSEEDDSDDESIGSQSDFHTMEGTDGDDDDEDRDDADEGDDDDDEDGDALQNIIRSLLQRR